MKIIRRQSGVSIIATLLSLMVMAGMGAVIAYMVAANQENRINHFQSLQAFYVNQAGVEYAIKKVYEGEDGEVNSAITFGPGNFTSALSGNTLTVTGTVGNATRAYSIDRPNQATCVSVDTSAVGTEWSGIRIIGLTFEKNCLESATITQMTFSWVPAGPFDELTTIRIENANVYVNPAGIPSGTVADIADFTMNDANTKSINYIEFASMMTGKTVTMVFTMSDASTKSTIFVVP